MGLGRIVRSARFSAARVLSGFVKVLDPASDCPVSWTPAPLTPVWSGFDDFGPPDGAPMQIRVWFPSFTSGGSVLRECGRFPLVVLVNGQCQTDTNPHLHSGPIATSLGRSGYIVAAPNFGGAIDFNSQTDFSLLDAAVQWMRGTSPFAPVVFPWEVGIAGHSYGGLLAMRYALRATIPPVSTIAILGSAVSEDTTNLDLLRTRFTGFRLFCWAGRTRSVRCRIGIGRLRPDQVTHSASAKGTIGISSRHHHTHRVPSDFPHEARVSTRGS